MASRRDDVVGNRDTVGGGTRGCRRRDVGGGAKEMAGGNGGG